MRFWFEVWADPRWKGTTPLHDDFYKIPANASSFPSMSDQRPDDEFRTVRDTLMARHILHAWNLEQMERGAHSIFDRKDVLPVGRANDPETTRRWRGPRDWMRGTGQSGLSEKPASCAVLQCQGNVCSKLVGQKEPLWTSHQTPRDQQGIPTAACGLVEHVPVHRCSQVHQFRMARKFCHMGGTSKHDKDLR